MKNISEHQVTAFLKLNGPFFGVSIKELSQHFIGKNNLFTFQEHDVAQLLRSFNSRKFDVK